MVTSICSHFFLHTVSIFPFSIKKHIIFFSSALNTVDRRICICSFRSWSKCSSHSLHCLKVSPTPRCKICAMHPLLYKMFLQIRTSFIHVCCSVVRTIKNNQQTEFVQEITQFFGNVFCSVTFGNMLSTKYAAKDVSLLINNVNCNGHERVRVNIAPKVTCDAGMIIFGTHLR